ncbi:MAG: hypothetical protein WC593_07360 [Methanoregula sp.]
MDSKIHVPADIIVMAKHVLARVADLGTAQHYGVGMITGMGVGKRS